MAEGNGTELAVAYVTLIPSLKGATSTIEKELGGVDTSKAGKRIGSSLGDAVGSALDVTPVTKRLDSVGDSLIDAGSALSSLGDKVMPVSAALIGGATAAGTFALKTASAAETSEMAFTTMLGSAEDARDMLETLSDFAAKTPFELSGLTTATQQLLAYGFAAEDVIPMLTAVGDATAALGTGQAGIESVTRALGQMQTRGKVAADEMLQLTEAGIPAWEYLAEAIGTDTAGAMEAVSAGAVDAQTGINALVAGMENDFGGMMEEQSKTVEGLMSNLTDAIEQPLMALRDSDAYESFAESLSKVVDAAGPLVESLLPHMEKALDVVAGVLDSAADAMDGFSSMSEDAQEGIINLVAGAAAAGPVLKVAGSALTGLGKSMKTASSLLEKGQSAVSTLSDKLLDLATAPGTADTMLGKLAGTIAQYPGVAALAVAGIALVVSAVVSFAQEAAEAEQNARTQAEAMDVLAGAAGLAGTSMEESASGIEQVSVAIQSTSDAVQENWQNIADLADTFDEISQKAYSQVEALGSARSIIAEYAGQTDLTTEEQGKLRYAIEQVNEQCGTSYEVAKDAGGAYQIMSDGAAVAKDEIYKLIDAQIAQTKIDAYSDKLSELYSLQADQAMDYAQALDDLTAAQEAYDAAVEKYGETGAHYLLDDLEQAEQNVADLKTQMDATSGSIAACEDAVGGLSAASDGAITGFEALVNSSGAVTQYLSEAGLDIDDFVADLQNSGISMEQYSALTSTQLMELATSWDGTASSISTSLEGLDVDLGDAGTRAVTALANGLLGGTVDVESATAVVQAAAEGDWSGVAAAMGSAGIELPKDVAAGITSGSYAATEATDYMLSLVALKLSGGDVEAAAQMLGSDIDEGLAQGIRDGTLSESEAAMLGDDVIEAAKESLESHSPSQAFYRIGSDVDAGLANGISGNATNPINSIAELGQQLISSISGLPDDAQKTGSDASGALSTGLSSKVGSVRSSADSLASAAKGGTSGVPSLLGGYGTSASSKFASGIASGVGKTRTNANKVADAAENMKSGTGSASSWGSHLASNFASGISSAIGAVRSAANSIANAAKSILGFSVPDDGPWSGSEKGGYTSGLHLGRNFAEGMVAAIPLVRDAAEDMALAASVPATSYSTGAQRRAAATATGGPVTYNVYIDGAKVTGNSEVNDLVGRLVGAAVRTNSMGVR